MGYGSFLGGLLKNSNRIVGGIGKVVDTGRKIGSIIDQGRKIGSIVNNISGGRLMSSDLGKKVNEAVNRVEKINNHVIGGGNTAINKITEFQRMNNR